MRADLKPLLEQLPGAASALYPEGSPFLQAFAHGSLSVELFAPTGHDRQSPHQQDELYVVMHGRADFLRNEGDRLTRESVGAGTVLLVPAGQVHRFIDCTVDFITYVVFYGLVGGESHAR